MIVESQLVDVYREIKFWLPIIAAGGFIYRGMDWFKGLRQSVEIIRTNDLVHIHGMVSDMKDGLVDQTKHFTDAFEKQTGALVGELKELRSDIRGLNLIYKWDGHNRRSQ